MGLTGTLSELRLADLIEMMSLGRKTGVLSIRAFDGAPAGDLLFDRGALVDARCGRLRGEKAVFALLAVPDGAFAVDTSTAPPPEARALPTQSLLMEGMRRLDEAQQLRRRLPGAARITLRRPGTPRDDTEAQIMAQLSLATIDVAELVRRVVGSGRADEYECLMALESLRTRDLISVAPTPRVSL